MAMTASSPAPGTPAGVQLVDVDQVPELAEFQFTVAIRANLQGHVRGGAREAKINAR